MHLPELNFINEDDSSVLWSCQETSQPLPVPHSLSGMCFPLHMAWLSLVCASALSSHASSSKQTTLILSRWVTLSVWILQPPGLPALMAPVSLYFNNIYQPGQLPPSTMGCLRAQLCLKPPLIP